MYLRTCLYMYGCVCVCVKQLWLTVHGSALRLNAVFSQNEIQGHFSPPKINANTSHLEYLIDSQDTQLQCHSQTLVCQLCMALKCDKAQNEVVLLYIASKRRSRARMQRTCIRISVISRLKFFKLQKCSWSEFFFINQII